MGLCWHIAKEKTALYVLGLLQVPEPTCDAMAVFVTHLQEELYEAFKSGNAERSTMTLSLEKSGRETIVHLTIDEMWRAVFPEIPIPKSMSIVSKYICEILSEVPVHAVSEIFEQLSERLVGNARFVFQKL